MGDDEKKQAEEQAEELDADMIENAQQAAGEANQPDFLDARDEDEEDDES